MREAIIFFFVVFLAIGHINGYQARREPDHLKQAAMTNMELWEDAGHYQFHYTCNDRTIYKYDIDSNELLEHIDQIKKNEESRATRDLSSISLNDVRTVLGGSVGAWTLKDVVEFYIKDKCKKKIVLNAFAGVSGYSLGKKTAAVWEPSCDELSGTTVLEDRASWKQFERSQYIESRDDIIESGAIVILEDTLANDGRVGEDEKREINDAIKAFSDSNYIDPEHDFESGDFEKLYRIQDLGEKYRAAYVMRQQTPSIGPRQ